MRKIRLLVVGLITVTVLAAGYLMLRSQGLLGSPNLTAVKAVPAGHQEIVFLAPATSSDSWERLVAAVKSLAEEWPKIFPKVPLLIPSYKKAFLNLTADVPEISLHFEGYPQSKMWIRWYKLSSESSVHAWFENLTKRNPPPLAIIGGDNSDRAYTIARDLEEYRKSWQGTPPLFLITTATADRVYPDAFADPNPTDPESYPKLTDVYRDATFRFSFTNRTMAEATLDFVRQHGEKIWLPAPEAQPLLDLTVAAWQDDPYSRDLAERFPRVFLSPAFLGIAVGTVGMLGSPAGQAPVAAAAALFPGRIPESNTFSIAFSVGDFDEPNQYESKVVGNFLQNHRADHRQLLVLPTNAQRARRFLRDLNRRDRDKVKNLVVASGDSISFNNIYRDHEVLWNFLDLPMPLLFFSHRNPVDENAGFGKTVPGTGKPSKTGTQDLLLYRDILAALIEAGMPQQKAVNSSNLLKERLRQLEWRKGQVFHPDYAPALPGDPDGTRGVPLFDEEGNRRTRTGERIVLLKPDLSASQADISFWGRINDPADRTWRLLGKTLTLAGPGRASD